MKRKLRSARAEVQRFLVSAETSAALDKEAITQWGFNSYALVEAAGRECARVFHDAFPHLFRDSPRIAVAAGPGNNGADAMVMLRYWILSGELPPSSAILVLGRAPETGYSDPNAELINSLKKLKVPVHVWEGEAAGGMGRSSPEIFAQSAIIVDGISGTGLKGPARGTALELINAVNSCSFLARPFVVSVDIPSGNFDGWKNGMPIIKADCTLSIEPGKYCVYKPVARPYAGTIVPVRGIFPPELTEACEKAELLDWESARKRIPKINPNVYKTERGVVEIWAGSQGATGAAFIAARGAQAAGAGLVRLITDDNIYPILASQVSGVMVIPSGQAENSNLSHKPGAILLGPGWGLGPARKVILEKAMEKEKLGTALILDADAIILAKGMVFSGNTILTPHPGEFSKFTGVALDELLSDPLPVITEYAGKCNALILFKGHVLFIATPDGKLGVIDGMTPALATGGSGDLLAGICAAIASRMVKEKEAFNAYACAAAAASLLIESGRARGLRARFADPLEIADRAADLAGAAWLDDTEEKHDRF